VELNCPKCGARNWLENQSRCLACNAVLRRCVDCASYDSGHERCSKLGAEVERYEAENPSLLSASTNCLTYQYGARA
jgi:predicted nucleic-acid-binding Zn-ribbon protein